MLAQASISINNFSSSSGSRCLNSESNTLLNDSSKNNNSVEYVCLRKRALNDSDFLTLLLSLNLELSYSLSSISFHNLIDLDLSYNRLENVPLPEILATNLKRVNLASNQLVAFPSFLKYCNNLETLILTRNRLQGYFPEELPACLPKLTTLQMAENQICGIPNSFCNFQKLRTLILGSVCGGNLLERLPEHFFSSLRELRYLDISNNRLRELPEVLAHHLTQLTQLIVPHNKLVSLPSSIGQCSQLTSLDLSSNFLMDLPIQIVDLARLQSLNLSRNRLCIVPNDITHFLRKTCILLTGNPLNYQFASRDSIGDFSLDLTGNNVHVTTASTSSSSIRLTETEEEKISGSTNFKGLTISSSFSRSLSMLGYATPDLHGNNKHIQETATEDLQATPRHNKKARLSNPLIPSLRELCSRVVFQHNINIKEKACPLNIYQYLSHGARPCSLCLRPYVHEYVEGANISHFQGHPQTLIKLHFCSGKCWNQYYTSRLTSPSSNNTDAPADTFDTNNDQHQECNLGSSSTNNSSANYHNSNSSINGRFNSNIPTPQLWKFPTPYNSVTSYNPQQNSFENSFYLINGTSSPPLSSAPVQNLDDIDQINDW